MNERPRKRIERLVRAALGTGLNDSLRNRLGPNVVSEGLTAAHAGKEKQGLIVMMIGSLSDPVDDG
jgi:hypothetical protein